MMEFEKGMPILYISSNPFFSFNIERDVYKIGWTNDREKKFVSDKTVIEFSQPHRAASEIIETAIVELVPHRLIHENLYIYCCPIETITEVFQKTIDEYDCHN